MAAALAGQPPVALKYLFKAYFADGSVIEQTADDRSVTDPSKSAFYDVLQRNGLIVFILTDEEFAYGVDLRDGRFAVEGVWFEAQPCSSDEIPPGGTYRLIYFRDHQQDMQVAADRMEFGGHRVAYRFGWEYTVAGRRWVQTIVLR